MCIENFGRFVNVLVLVFFVYGFFCLFICLCFIFQLLVFISYGNWFYFLRLIEYSDEVRFYRMFEFYNLLIVYQGMRFNQGYYFQRIFSFIVGQFEELFSLFLYFLGVLELWVVFGRVCYFLIVLQKDIFGLFIFLSNLVQVLFFLEIFQVYVCYLFLI